MAMALRMSECGGLELSTRAAPVITDGGFVVVVVVFGVDLEVLERTDNVDEAVAFAARRRVAFFEATVVVLTEMSEDEDES
jgi:hypothetical protein